MYGKILETLDGNVSFLTTQIQPWIQKYGCRSAFDLFNHPFEDPDEKARVMGYVHRRDAYITIANQIRAEQTSIKEERDASVTGTISKIRKVEIVGNQFVRDAEDALTKAWMEDKDFLERAGMNIEETWHKLDNCIAQNNIVDALPLFITLWYNDTKEVLGTIRKVE